MQVCQTWQPQLKCSLLLHNHRRENPHSHLDSSKHCIEGTYCFGYWVRKKRVKDFSPMCFRNTSLLYKHLRIYTN